MFSGSAIIKHQSFPLTSSSPLGALWLWPLFYYRASVCVAGMCTTVSSTSIISCPRISSLWWCSMGAICLQRKMLKNQEESEIIFAFLFLYYSQTSVTGHGSPQLKSQPVLNSHTECFPKLCTDIHLRLAATCPKQPLLFL